MNKILLLVLVILAGIAFGWFYFNGDFRSPRTTLKTSTISSELSSPPVDGSAPLITDESLGAGDTKGGVGGQFLFTYTENGFTPKEMIVKKGDTVTFINQSGNAMWVASAVHPTHQVLPGFDQKKSVAKGGTYVYTFLKEGTWKFHNHVSPEMMGTVVVK